MKILSRFDIKKKINNGESLNPLEIFLFNHIFDSDKQDHFDEHLLASLEWYRSIESKGLPSDDDILGKIIHYKLKK